MPGPLPPTTLILSAVGNNVPTYSPVTRSDARKTPIPLGSTPRLMVPLPPRGKEAQITGAVLASRIRAAKQAAEGNVERPMCHGSLCVAALILIQSVRVFAWYEGINPFFSVIGMHCLSVTSDLGCIACCLPLYLTGVSGPIVKWACLGPIVSMVFAMVVVDVGGVIAYCIMAPSRAMPPAWRSVWERLEAVAGVWESLLLASVAVQVTLLVNSWCIYRELRLAGLYPPGNSSIAKGQTVEHVSILEVMCEAEDIALLGEYSETCPCMAAPELTGDSAGGHERRVLTPRDRDGMTNVEEGYFGTTPVTPMENYAKPEG